MIAGWGVSPDQPMFSVMKPFDGQAASVGNGTMVALGGQDEGAPGPRGTGFYGHYFRDLDGNKMAGFVHAEVNAIDALLRQQRKVLWRTGVCIKRGC